MYDLNMPKQVQDMGAQADKIQSDLINPGQEPGTAQQTTPVGTAPLVTPNEPLNTPQSQPAQQQDLEQKYRSLLGRVESLSEELKTARTNNDLLYNQISDLNKENAKLQTDLAAAQAQTTKPDDKKPDTGPKLLDVDQMSQYGAEFGDMAKTMNQLLTNQQAPRPAQQPPAAAPMQPNDKAIFRSSVVSDIYAAHQLDYNAIDVAPEFMSWLKEFDQVSGVQKAAGWGQAVATRDKATCLSTINNFLVSPQGQAFKNRVTNPVSQQAPNQQPNVPLGTHTDPTAVTTQPVGKIYTGAEVRKFFNDVATGEYKGTPDEATQEEADIMKAGAEGRVQG